MLVSLCTHAEVQQVMSSSLFINAIRPDLSSEKPKVNVIDIGSADGSASLASSPRLWECG